MTLRVVSVRVVAICSKHRTSEDRVPMNTLGVPYTDDELACPGCIFTSRNNDHEKVQK